MLVLKSKDFRLSKTKIEYFEWKFSDITHGRDKNKNFLLKSFSRKKVQSIFVWFSKKMR